MSSGPSVHGFTSTTKLYSLAPGEIDEVFKEFEKDLIETAAKIDPFNLDLEPEEAAVEDEMSNNSGHSKKQASRAVSARIFITALRAGVEAAQNIDVNFTIPNATQRYFNLSVDDNWSEDFSNLYVLVGTVDYLPGFGQRLGILGSGIILE